MATKTFAETDCTFNFGEHSCTSGGAYIGVHRKTGKLGGLLYIQDGGKMVGDWHGDDVTPVEYAGKVYRSNFGDRRQTLYFHWHDTPMMGVYMRENSDIVRCKQIKEWRQ